MGNLKLKCKRCEKYLEAHSSYNTFNHKKRRPEVTIIVEPCKYCLKIAEKEVHTKVVKRVRDTTP